MMKFVFHMVEEGLLKNLIVSNIELVLLNTFEQSKY